MIEDQLLYRRFKLRSFSLKLGNPRFIALPFSENFSIDAANSRTPSPIMDASLGCRDQAHKQGAVSLREVIALTSGNAGLQIRCTATKKSKQGCIARPDQAD